MRKLKITREKAFSAKLITVKIYIVDPNSGDLTVSGERCRKLGEIANASSAVFEIGEEAARIYVVNREKSPDKDLINDYYDIPAGSDDVELTGRCIYDVNTGFPFRFENVTVTPEMQAHRSVNAAEYGKVLKKARVRGAVIGAVIGIAVIVLLAVLSRAGNSGAKTYAVNGFSIDLPATFREYDPEPGDYAYFENRYVSVWVTRYGYEDGEEFTSMSLDEFSKARRTFLENEDGIRDVKTLPGDIPGCSFVYRDGSDDLTYHDYYYRSANACWIVEFCCDTSDAEKYEKQFAEWAKTVVLPQNAAV